MIFSKPWIIIPTSKDREIVEPALAVYLRTANGRFVRETFIVDSGADMSMGLRKLCELLDLDWEAGEPVQLHGISPRPECAIKATIHEVEIYVREAALSITIPICFADGDAPLLLGREGFFDFFRVQFDKQRQLTTFELANAEGA